MNQAGSTDSSELVKSLADLRRLRASTGVSVALMLLGVAIVIGTLIYSAAILQPLERQVAISRVQLNDLTISIKNKEHELLCHEKRLEEVKRELALINGQLFAAKNLLANVSRSELQRTAEANPRAARVLPRVYIHIASEDQRSAVEQLQKTLQGSGFLVPPVENTGRKGLGIPVVTEVRFGDQSDSARAQQISRTIQERFQTQVRVHRLVQRRYRLAPGTFEVWFSKQSLEDRG